MLFLVITALVITTSSGRRELSELQEAEIQRHLKRINEPAVKSIKSLDGDIFDCVNITNQLAFDHPLLKNHTIQSGFISTQLWQRSGKCPENTVPIRRTTREDLLRWGSIESYGKKDPNSIRNYGSHPAANNDPTVHEYAIIRGRRGGIYNGIEAAINVWKPHVQELDEFSLAQMWILGGIDAPDLNSLEAGWQVYPRLYGDDNPQSLYFLDRCYNHMCSGFVQTNQGIGVGATFDRVSTYDGEQFMVTLLIMKDPQSGDWWLIVNDVSVGYWPKSILSHLKGSASAVEWGGEILNFKVGGRHTSTGMGSGHFAEEGFKKSCNMDHISIVDEHHAKRDAEIDQAFMDNAKCYNLAHGSNDPKWRTYIYFGGPGQNPGCP
ncbi:PREDICTED: uncharacterized protein LOC104804800 [Tarenaya hassleriana]|uniref:uncharacterized protein LOC104804800 n=1 Tax=Tarenaya hassleriana TaxID=28532 RepID=UPI00053C7BA8|nr:PREDICTED: uncharacterized protein LOC104804800 [Tarenaya hassleriana]